MPKPIHSRRASPVPLSGARTAIGCDLGGTNIKLARLGVRGIEALRSLPTPPASGPAGLVAVLAGAVKELLPPGRGRVPVGVAVPGFLDAGRRTIVRLSNLPALNGAALGSLLERRLPLARVALDTDTNAGAVAEARFGAGRRRDRVLYVTLGTGLGAALVVAGDPVRVSRHTVGQIAHLPLGVAGRRCYCGVTGCAETLLNARGIVDRAAHAGLRGIQTPLDLARIAAGRGAEAARARAVWVETGALLGRVLHVLAAMLSPDVIVIGGGISRAAPRFLPAARQWVRRRLTPRLSPEVVLRPATLGDHAGAVGAAFLASGPR